MNKQKVKEKKIKVSLTEREINDVISGLVSKSLYFIEQGKKVRDKTGIYDEISQDYFKLWVKIKQIKDKHIEKEAKQEIKN